MLILKVEQRIAQYIGFLERNAYRELQALGFETFETAETLRRPPANVTWTQIKTPFGYGKPWTCSWFRASFRAPKDASLSLFLKVVPNADSLAFLDGAPIGAFNPYHTKLRIPADGAEHVLHLEAYAGHPYPGMHPFQGDSIMLTLSRQIPAYPNTFEGGSLLARAEAVYSLYYDVMVLFDLAKILDAGSLRRARILKGLYDALMGISLTSTGEALEDAAATAAKRIAPLLAARNGDTTPEIDLIGHAHIDHAWLWHIGETERKAARTFANMARFSEEYPEFVFIQSQPCQLDIIRREYPEVFASVKAAYERGAWEPNGGMWVEADCNVTGGESLVRQFLVGKATTAEMLGYESDTLWLPDVFGYAAALPQILAGCGIDYFVTSKINWNDTTRFPYDTFRWSGIDGTEVRTHYISSRTEGYNGRVSPHGLAEIYKEVQHKEIQSSAIKSVGEGDGGGGTARADLEQARRLRNLEGAPKAKWTKVSDALKKIFAQSDDLPVWRGELYLELHRGTYTTQARTKRWNRKLEFALCDAEFLSAFLRELDGTPYPAAELLSSWKTVLTNQFHDIIPGSSIGRVYEEADAAYRKVDSAVGAIASRARERIASRVAANLVLFNDLSWERRDAVAVPASALKGIAGSAESKAASPSFAVVPAGASGESCPVQVFVDLDGVETAVFAPRVPPLGWAAFSLQKATVPAGSSPFVYRDGVLETPFYRVRFDGAGRISALADLRRGRELVAVGGRFNAFVGAEDVPILWDAWDIDSDWTKSAVEELKLLSSEVVADGAICFRLRQKYGIGASSVLVQDVVFYAADPRIDFDTRVDWQETRRLLKVEFDTAMNSTKVRCEVQYGHVVRNAHRNLPNDRAQFEFCAHKWISLEEEGGGLALLNDCKYGHDAEGGRMRLTLLRSPIAPDENADRGAHRFVYSILPFAGAFGASRVVGTGYELNVPVASASGASAPMSASGALPLVRSFCAVEGDAVVVEAVKATEAGTGLVALRVYESLGGRASATLRFGEKLAGAWASNMLERDLKPLPFDGNALSLDFRAFEIQTIIVEFTR